MDIEDLFGDYQNGNYNVVNNKKVNNNLKNEKKEKAPKAPKEPKAPGSKKGGAGIIFVLLLLIIVVAGGYGAYAYTDLFKSPEQLMSKYSMDMVQKVVNKGRILEDLKNKDAGTLEVKGKLTIPDNYATEDSDSSIRYNIDLKQDLDDYKTEFTASMPTEGSDAAMDATFYASNECFAAGSSLIDLSETSETAKYIGLKNSDLKKFAQKLGVPDEYVEYIPDSIAESLLKEGILSKEEINTLKNKYVPIIKQVVTKEKYSVDKNASLEIEGQTYKLKKVTITLTGQDALDIINNVLEVLREDETIMGIYTKVTGNPVDDDVKEKYAEIIDKMKESLNEDANPSGTLVISQYINGNEYIASEIALYDEGEEEPSTYYLYYTIINDNVEKDVVISKESLSTYKTTSTSTMLITSTDDGEKIEVTTVNEYEDLGKKQTEDSDIPSYSDINREPVETSYVIDITEYNENGFKISAVLKDGDDESLKFNGTVSINQSLKFNTYDDKTTIFLNDMTMEEISELGEKINPFGGLNDYNYDYEDSNYEFESNDDTIPSYTLPDDDFLTTDFPDTEDNEDEEDQGTVTLEGELQAVIDLCNSEAGNNEYTVRDYLSVDNFKGLCPSILNMTEESNTTDQIVYEVVSSSEKTYVYTVTIISDDQCEGLLNLKD